MELFQRPLYVALSLLAGILAAALARWSEARRLALASLFAKPRAMEKVTAASVARHRGLKHGLKAAALMLVLAALAGPQWGVELVTTQAAGVQAVIAVDVSASMLAEDLKPNRMEKAKGSLSLLIDGLRGERLGLVAFAGEAQVACPVTTDSEAVKSFLRRMGPGAVPQPGSDLGKAVALAARILRRYPGQKALILLTDGEDHGKGAADAVREAAQEGVRLFVIGMGTPEGEPIPIKDAAGRVVGYKRDRQGRTVVSRLGEKGLIELAAAGAGAYFRATPADAEIVEILEQVRALESAAGPAGSTNRFRSRYRIPAALALLLLLIELLLPEASRRGGAQARSAALRPAAALALLLAAGLSSGCQVPTDMRLWRGNSAYGKERYDEALRRYEGAARADAADPRPLFNSGAALYKMDEHERAREAFAGLVEPDRPLPRDLAAKSLYNMGNALFRQGKSGDAAAAYRKCLLRDPSDEACRFNLVVALRDQKKKQDPKPDKKDPEKKDEKKEPEKGSGDPNERQQPQDAQGRPQPQTLSREDAERILQAVREKERQAAKAMPAQPQPSRPDGGPVGEDW